MWKRENGDNMILGKHIVMVVITELPLSALVLNNLPIRKSCMLTKFPEHPKCTQFLQYQSVTYTEGNFA